MKVRLHKNFEKMWGKLPNKVKQQAVRRIKQFTENPASPILHDHALRADYKGYRSINISGDYRAIYRVISDKEVIFTHIGTHSQLYR